MYSDALTFIYNRSDLFTGLSETKRAVITVETAVRQVNEKIN